MLGPMTRMSVLEDHYMQRTGLLARAGRPAGDPLGESAWRSGVRHESRPGHDVFELPHPLPGVPRWLDVDRQGGRYVADSLLARDGSRDYETRLEQRDDHEVLVAIDRASGLETRLDPVLHEVDVRTPDTVRAGSPQVVRTEAHEFMDRDGNVFFFAHEKSRPMGGSEFEVTVVPTDRSQAATSERWYAGRTVERFEVEADDGGYMLIKSPGTQHGHAPFVTPRNP